MTSVKEWIEEKIKNEYIRYFEYDKFSQITEIDRGGFGKVSKANLANAGLVALKIFFSNNSNIEEDELNEANDGFIKELKYLREIDYHQNINRILGITKDSEYYILVLEYANEGNLRDYLKKNFTSLKWNNKIQMALDITSGLKFLHSKEVIHRDLHSKNILVNNGKLLIADFGLSKKLAEAKIHSSANKIGMVEYIEPQCFKSFGYMKNKKSDIYGLGVLLWEISSGRPPFLNYPREALAFHISYGNIREEPTEGTPLKYQQLYQKCWDGEPKSRPDIEEVYEILLKTSFDLQSQYNEDKSNSKTDDDDLIIPSNYQIINSKNENGKPSQLKTGSFDLQSPPHLKIPNNNNRSNSKALLTIPSDSQNLNSRNEKKKKGNPRNLLIIGHAGSGKSTLTNVLSNTVDFEESECSKNFRKQMFEWEGIKYHVVDDIGMALTNKEVMYEKMSEVYYLIPEGISQILFVIDGKFTAEEESAFSLFEDSIFGNDIAEYITIVRTKFSNFKNEREYKKDKDDLYNENETVAKLCKSIIHIDNPPMNIFVHDEDDRETIIFNKRRRDQSREILLDHLNKVCGKKYKSIYLDGTTSSKKKNEENYTPKLMKRLTSFINLNSALFKLNPNKLEREQIRNLLIIGRTGSGKSALSDVLCGTYDLSNTVKKNFQQKSFEWKGTKYRLIEIRIKLIEKKVLFNKIGEIIYSMSEGISQVLFVVNGRFTAEEIETFKVFGKVILESGIIEHTTIIRTKFANFEKKNECERDKKELCGENEIISKMVRSCRAVIYVDNPPTNIQGVERREKSRTILLHHLKTACQRFYKFGTWDVLYDKIASYMKESEITSTLEDYIAKEVEFNLISDIPALSNVNFDAYHKYRIEIASRKILKDIITIDLGENIESIPDTQLPNSASLMKFWKKTELSTNETNKKIIQHFKLDHGLFLNEFTIKPGNQPIFTEDGELNIRLYNGQPIVYININDPSSTNLLDFNNKLQSFDVCINFLIAEITYKSELLEDFSKCNDNEENFHELYGHFFARKVSVGNKLFIKEFNSATQTQIGILKFYLLCAYNIAKYSIEIQFQNLFTLDLLPKMETSDGEELNTYEKLVKWVNNLYPQKTSDEKKLNTHAWVNKLCQDNKIDIISYGNFVTTSDLRCSILSIYDSETFDEKQPGIINFKEKLSLENWVMDVEYDNLISLITDSHLFQGLIFNQSCEMKVSEEIAINLLEVPKVNVRDKSCLEIIRPSTKLEVNLISNNIFSIKDLNIFPFIENDEEIYEDYNHVLLKCEQYEIILNKNNIKPTETFEKVVEKALNSMKPLKSLQDIFNKYGHLFPQRIILGSSLKIILQNSSSSDAFDNINLKSPIFDSLKSYLDKLNISYLLTQKGKSIENQDLDNWIKDANDNLEIIEFDNIIPLYKILKKEQRSKIEDLLKNNYKILMTGVTNLGDLNNNNVEYYKRINIKPSLEDENYEVIGSIISEKNTKLEEININFGLYDYNGFFAVIKKLETTNIDITRCYILWMIIGIPSKSSVFSPKNRKIQVNYIKESITLQPNQSCYPIKVPFLLSEDDVISVYAYYSLTNLEPNSIIIKLIKWKDRFVDVQITDIISMSDIELHICVLHSYDGKLKIDNEEELEYPLDLIGCILTDENNADVN